MITFDYQIKRDEKDEVKTYTPKIPKKLNDLVCIEGPNSIGKSTFLNIIALGLYGRKNKSITDPLQIKLDELIKATHQTLTFSFEISNKKNNLKIISEKKDSKRPQIDLYEIKNGKKRPLTFESFEKKYNLIYDIPENPLGRLKELAKEIKEQQNQLQNRTYRLGFALREILAEIDRARNPEKIKKFKKSVETLDVEVGSQKLDAKLQSEELEMIKKYFHCNYFFEHLNNLKRLESVIEEKEKEYKKENRKRKKRDKGVEKFLEEQRCHVNCMRGKMNETITKLRKAKIKVRKNYLGFFEDKDIVDLLKDKEKHNIIFLGIEAFKEKVAELKEEAGKNEKLKESRLLIDLIEVLEKYANTHIVVPGTDKTVNDFINILRKKSPDYDEHLMQHQFYTTLQENLDDVYVMAKRYVEYFLPTIETLEKELGESEGLPDFENELKVLEKERKEYKNKCEYHKEEFIKLGVKESAAQEELGSLKREHLVKAYGLHGEDDLEDVIKSKKKNLDDLNKNIKENEYILVHKKNELNRLEKQEPHPYQIHKKSLENIFKASQSIESKLVNEFDRNIQLITKESRTGQKITEKQKKYFDSVAHYFARKMRTLRHGDMTFDITQIDLLGKKVHTKSGKVIFFSDLGTGQSQAAYLKSKLTTADKRKIIALIDDVAMMDASSMQSIFDLLAEQYGKGDILAGVVVKKNDKNINITSIC